MDADARRARRAFIRANHPDHGGDPDRFVAGLAAFDARTTGQPPVRVHVVPAQRWPVSLVSRLLRRHRRPPRVR